jgi:hypothetical protein
MPPTATRKLRHSFVRMLRSFAPENTCSSVGDLRTRCNQWTRTQRIRTAAAIPVVALIVDTSSIPAYLQIGRKATHLRELGISDKSIGRALGVSDKTAAKAIAAAQDAAVAESPDASGPSPICE